MLAALRNIRWQGWSRVSPEGVVQVKGDMLEAGARSHYRTRALLYLKP